jgi:predicted O-methyltransferase YrrM
LVGSDCKTHLLKPKRIFEIGTFHRSTTLQMGLDAPVDSERLCLIFRLNQVQPF